MIIDDVCELMYDKKCEIVSNGTRLKDINLNIYIGVDLYKELKVQIKGEQPYHAVLFHQEDTIMGHPVYTVTNDPRHLTIAEVTP